MTAHYYDPCPPGPSGLARALHLDVVPAAQLDRVGLVLNLLEVDTDPLTAHGTPRPR